MVYIFIIFSFLFESVMTNIVNINSILIPVFLLTSLSILYPYFKNNTIFIVVCLLCGFFYDISIGSTFINTISYFFCGLFLIISYKYLKYNIYSANSINIVDIILYRIISYVLLCIVDFTNFKFLNLFSGIYNSLIINLIYGIIIYIIINLVAKLFNIRRN